jgi:hypothetical protein
MVVEAVSVRRFLRLQHKLVRVRTEGTKTASANLASEATAKLATAPPGHALNEQTTLAWLLHLLSRNGWIASSGPALLISFSEGISIASSKRVFGELGWFRQSCGTFRGISA